MRALDRRLLATVRGRAIEGPRRLLAAGADPNAVDGRGRTPLHAVARGDRPGSRELAELLLKHGADPNAVDGRGRTPLHLAVQGDSVELARLLLEHAADVNVADRDGYTPLHWSTWVKPPDHAAMVRLLLEHGAELGAVDKDGETVLHWCAATTSLVTVGRVALLLEAGADADARDKDGRTPLHLACSVWRSDALMARLLLEHGADPNARDAKGEVPLQGCARRFPPATAVDVLQKHGADLELVRGGVLTVESCRQDWRVLREELAVADAQLKAAFSCRNGDRRCYAVTRCRSGGHTPRPFETDLQRRCSARLIERVGCDLLAIARPGWHLEAGIEAEVIVRATDPPVRLVVRDDAGSRLLDAWFAHDGVVVGGRRDVIPEVQAPARAAAAPGL